MVRALSVPGRRRRSMPQPMQSSGETRHACTAVRPALALVASSLVAAAGAPAASSSVSSEGTDGGVGADEGALVALDAVVGVPRGHGARRRRASRTRRCPAGTVPSACCMKADTGRLSPSMRPDGHQDALDDRRPLRHGPRARAPRRIHGVGPARRAPRTCIEGGDAGVDGARSSCRRRPGPSCRRTSWRRPSCTAMASSMGMTLASVKNADCRMVLVRLPMPISRARSMASMV